MRKSWIAAAVPLALVAGCGGGTSTAGTGDDVVLMAKDVSRSQPSSSAPVSAAVTGLDAFGQDLLRSTAGDKNAVISPLSMAYAFGMLDAGARGETAAQIERVMHFPGGQGTHEALNALLQRVDPPTAKELSIANALFVQRGMELREQFLRVLAEQYGTGARPVDFAGNHAIGPINEWVRAQTKNRIKKVFDSLDENTKVVLANAIHMKAAWALPFDPAATTDDVFHRPSGDVRTPMMHIEKRFRYAAGTGWQAVELPYADSQLAMWVLVPTGRTAPVDLLAPEVLKSVRRGLAPTAVDVALPRWDFGTDIQLKPVLKRLGMTLAFADGRADLSGIALEKGQLFVGQAIHRANITVDEAGTEAAAVTGISVELSSALVPQATIRADHPFAFVIVHKPTGTPVFTGQVTDPTAQE
jgi:serine protease inhibitor